MFGMSNVKRLINRNCRTTDWVIVFSFLSIHYVDTKYIIVIMY